MSQETPAAVLSGEQTGNICDRCNRGIRTGDKARFYATYYENSGWTLRRVYCSDCGTPRIETGTDGEDEVVGEAVFWKHRLAGVEITDRSRPEDGDLE